MRQPSASDTSRQDGPVPARGVRQMRPALAAALALALASGPAAAVPALPAAAGPLRAFGAYLAGTVAGHLGDSAAAADLLLDALAHDPDNPTVLQPAFLFSTLAGRRQAPALAARAGLGLLSQLVLANDRAIHGDWDGAARGFAALPQGPLNDLIRPLLLSWAEQGGGHTDAALRTLATVGGNSPLAGAGVLQAGTIAELAGRTDTAASLYRTAQTLFIGSSLPVTEVLGSFLVRHGQGPQAQALAAGLVQQVGAFGLIAPALAASFDRPAVADARQGLARAYLAIAALLQSQDASAKDAVSFMLRFALDLQPDLTTAKLMMAEQGAADHPDAALAALAGVAPSDPLAPLVQLRVAALLAQAGRREQARAMLDALVRRFPDRPEPAQELGDVLSDAKLYAPAVTAYDCAIADRSRLGNGLAGNDWQLLFDRAVALDRQDHWPQAEADLERALTLAPDEPFLLNYLGYSLVERDLDLGKARGLIQRALDGKPDDGSIRDSLGWVMLQQHQVPAAVRTLERAAEQMPEDPTVNFHLGAAYWAAGRKVEAEDQWRWALVLKPEPDDAARIHDALRRAGIKP